LVLAARSFALSFRQLFEQQRVPAMQRARGPLPTVERLTHASRCRCARPDAARSTIPHDGHLAVVPVRGGAERSVETGSAPAHRDLLLLTWGITILPKGVFEAGAFGFRQVAGSGPQV
jgi:hypothetical protein